MYDSSLIDRVLLSPAQISGYQRLCIVSGYADPDMVSLHLGERLSGREVHVKLLIGMFPTLAWQDKQEYDWLRYRIRLRRFRDLMRGSFGVYGSTFQCRYVVEPPQVHAKVYVWLDEDAVPVKAFVGSPNYTQAGFVESRQGEVVTSDDYRESCYDYFVEHWGRAISCDAPDIERRLYDLRNRR